MDKSGNLYGTTGVGGSATIPLGTVFELSPPATSGGSWTESVLWNFGNGTDGKLPYAGVIIDKAGNLYGTTWGGGPDDVGTVFELTPPSSTGGNWSESILWSFPVVAGGLAPDGADPESGVVMDGSGNLYGATPFGGPGVGNPPAFFGTVYKLSPPSSSGGIWTESTLWDFGSVPNDGTSSYGTLVIDGTGNLYGTTLGGGIYGPTVDYAGTVFELTPPSSAGGSWSESILWNFGSGIDGGSPSAGLIMDASGNLYGTTYSGGSFGLGTNDTLGTVFEVLGEPALSSASLKVGKKKLTITAKIDSETGVEPKSRTVTLKNPKRKAHGASVNISRVSVGTTAFSVSQNCAITLAPGQSCKVTVTFTPSVAETVLDYLYVTSNAANGALQQIPLVGIGKSVN